MTTTTEPLRVDIWSDVVCPWCAIGKANLDRALERFPEADRVEIIWHSFELDPNAPAALAGDHAEQLARKYGMSVETARQNMDRVATTGRGVGLDLRFDRVRPGNTFDAHRVIHLAADRGIAERGRRAVPARVLHRGRGHRSARGGRAPGGRGRARRRRGR